MTIRRIGNSRGIILPQPLISQLGLGAEVELSVEDESIVLRKPRRAARSGWAKATNELAKVEENRLVWPEFANAGDSQLKW
jgi:antitoxin MazE